MKRFLQAATMVGILLASGQVMATNTWSLETNPALQFSTASAYNPVTNATVITDYADGTTTSPAALKMGVTGWADTGTSNNVDIQASLQYSAGNGLMIYNNCQAASATCLAPQGVDTYETQTGEHAIDNQTYKEMALLSFGSQVSLTNFKVGWNGTDQQVQQGTTYSAGDSDVTVLAYVGAAADAGTVLNGASWATILANTSTALNTKQTGKDWVVIGNYSNVGSNTASQGGVGTLSTDFGGGANISTTIYSSFWLIGAYNPLGATGSLAGLVNGSGGAVAADTGWDSIKLTAVTACVMGTAGCSSGGGGGNAPEPGSIVLFGLAMLGSVAVRGRRRR